MSSILRTGAIGVLSPISRTSLILAILVSAGCSADVTRFSYGGRDTTASLPLPSEPVGGGGNGPPRGLGLTEAPLPPEQSPGTYRVVGRDYGPRPSGYDVPPGYERPSPMPYASPSPHHQPPAQAHVPPGAHDAAPMPPSMPQPYAVPGRPPAHHAVAPGGGETVEVQPGETLYSIARRHGVSVADIKGANALTSETLRPGQRLVLPAAAFDRASLAKGPPPHQPPTPEPPSIKAPSPARGLLPGAQPPPGWVGRYVMRNGDTLDAIATRHGVNVDDLMEANNITDPTRLWGGTVLAVPEQRPAPTQASKGPPRIIQVSPKVINAAPEPPATKTAKRSDILSDARDTPAEFTGKFRWPARGKVVAGFGRGPDGKHNDGINILLPLGTDIVAAESGKVAYAGNELKGYGNLILIRHPNGWVTAYAHADRLLVNYDQEVRRGQVIAKAGRTGSVEEPQLHFELRRDSRPVDPLPHLGN